MTVYSELRKKAVSLGYKWPWDKSSLEGFLNDLNSLPPLKEEDTQTDIDIAQSKPIENYWSISDIVNSKTNDKTSIQVPEITNDILDVLLADNKMQEYLKEWNFKNKLFQDEFDIINFDLPTSIANITNFYRKTEFDKLDIYNMKETIRDKSWISFANWLDRWDMVKILAEHFWYYVYSFKLLWDIHDRIIEEWIPYEITMWVSEEFIREINNDEKADKEKYTTFTTKSFVWHKDNFYNFYTKRLRWVKFTIENQSELFENMNIPEYWYVVLPKYWLHKQTKNYLLLNQGMSELAQSAMKRGLYDWVDPKWPATKDWVVSYILGLKLKHKLK